MREGSEQLCDEVCLYRSIWKGIVRRNDNRYVKILVVEIWSYFWDVSDVSMLRFHTSLKFVDQCSSTYIHLWKIRAILRRASLKEPSSLMFAVSSDIVLQTIESDIRAFSRRGLTQGILLKHFLLFISKFAISLLSMVFSHQTFFSHHYTWAAPTKLNSFSLV